MQKKLEEIGKKLDVTKKDIAKVKGNYWKDYFLYIGAGIAIAVIFFVLGCCGVVNNAVNNVINNGAVNNAGAVNNTVNNVVNNGMNGYPYALVLPGAVKRRNKIILGLLGITAFLMLISVPVFGQAILYNVFRKK